MSEPKRIGLTKGQRALIKAIGGRPNRTHPDSLAIAGGTVTWAEECSRGSGCWHNRMALLPDRGREEAGR